MSEAEHFIENARKCAARRRVRGSRLSLKMHLYSKFGDPFPAVIPGPRRRRGPGMTVWIDGENENDHK